MRRRDVLSLIGGAAVSWPAGVRAQHQHPPRRIGMLIGYAENDPEIQARLGAFRQALEGSGWKEGRGLHIDYRFAPASPNQAQVFAKELVALQPDVLVGNSTPATAALLTETRTIPIVFVGVSDPVGSHFVAGIARPASSATGFTNFAPSMIGKWLEMLKRVAPGITRAAVMFNPETAPGGGLFFLEPFEAAAPTFAIEPIAARVKDADEIAIAVATIAREPHGSLIIMPDAFTTVHRQLIILLSARHALPAIYPYRYEAVEGGLLSYGVDDIDLMRRAAPYVDRILKGENVADLPVQAPIKFDLVVNLRAARVLGLTVPPDDHCPCRRGHRVNRRELIALLGSTAAVGWPLGTRAQPERVRRIGVLMTPAEDDPEGQTRMRAFVQGLQQLGWIDGGNVRIVTRWGAGNANDIRKYAAELVALAPDVILATGSVTVGPLLQATRTIPIVFVLVPDPIGAGFIESLARPGGNATGFINFEYGISAKWLELLKEIAPSTKRVAVLRDPDLAVGAGQFGAIQAAAPSLDVELTPINVRDAAEIERSITAFARYSNGAFLVTGSALAITHRDLIVTLAALHKLPAMYFGRVFVAAGGLMSFGPVFVDQYRQAAGYIDRILKGEKPADLPVQRPTRYRLVINLKTAKALGLDIPPMLLARADEVIE